MYTVVTTGNLKSGHTTSCGCMRYSQNEWIIAKHLRQWGVPFSREYTFPDLLSAKGIPLRFDFALLDSDSNLVALIEYQGIQHYVVHDGYEDFGRQQREVTDEQKRKYCQENNIVLYEISYAENVVETLRSITHTLYGNLVPSLAQQARKV